MGNESDDGVGSDDIVEAKARNHECYNEHYKRAAASKCKAEPVPLPDPEPELCVGFQVNPSTTKGLLLPLLWDSARRYAVQGFPALKASDVSKYFWWREGELWARSPVCCERAQPAEIYGRCRACTLWGNSRSNWKARK